MRGHSLAREISVEEMRHMEDVEGLSRIEIAKRLDISTPTVLKYLGPKQSKAKLKVEGEKRVGNWVLQTPSPIVTPSYEPTYVPDLRDPDPGHTFRKDNAAAAKDLNEYFKKTATVLNVVSDERVIKLNGSNYIYELAMSTKSKIVSVSDKENNRELMILDEKTICNLIQELSEIRDKYFREV